MTIQDRSKLDIGFTLLKKLDINALGSSAVPSIIKEVVDKIINLERELEERRNFTPWNHRFN